MSSRWWWWFKTRFSQAAANDPFSSYRYTMVLSRTNIMAKPQLRRKKIRITIAVLLFFASAASISLALALTLGHHDHKKPDLSGGQPSATAPNEPPESAYPDPEPMNGTTIPNNKSWRTMDPSLIRRKSDGKLFLFTTGAAGEPNGAVWTSQSSLYGPWTKSPRAMINQQAGAPQVYYLDGTYYMFHNHHFREYAKVGVTHPQANKWWHDASVFVRSSKTMEHGTWTFHGRLDIPWETKYNILDPSLITVDDGSAETTTREHYLSFGSYQTGLYQVPLANPPIKLADNAIKNLTHLEQNTTRISTGIKDRTEASFQYFREGWYYLFFSSGICCHFHGRWTEAIQDPYRVMVCRSQNHRGGFVDASGKECVSENGGTEILGTHGNVFAPGGQGVLDDDEVGGPILYYHYGESLGSGSIPFLLKRYKSRHQRDFANVMSAQFPGIIKLGK